MSHRIIDGFLSDSQKIAFNQWAEGPKCATDFHFGLDCGLSCQAPRGITQGRRQIVFIKRLRAQIPDVPSGFRNPVTHQHSNSVQVSFGHFRGSRHRARYHFKLHRDAEHLLRQVIVNFTSNAVALSQDSGKLRLYALKTESIKLPDEYRQAQKTEGVEPVGLVEVWLQIKIEGGAGGAPQAIIVRSDDSELIATGPQICIVSNATRSTVHPVAIKPFELVFEPDSFRGHKTERRVIKIQAALARRQLNSLTRANRFVIDPDLFDSNWRWLIV